MNKSIWYQLEQSLQKDISLVCINLPGYGQSKSIPYDYSLATLARVILPYLGNAEDNIILGWSLGGLVALEVARLYPKQVSRLILVACNPKFIQSNDWPYAVEEQVFVSFAEMLKQDIKKTIKRFIAIQAMGSTTVKKDIKIIQQLIEDRGYADYETLSKGLALLLSSDQRKTLGSLELPILMIAGNRDSLVNIEGLKSLCKQQTTCLTKLSLEIISGAGHAPFISHLQLFTDILRKNLGLNFE